MGRASLCAQEAPIEAHLGSPQNLQAQGQQAPGCRFRPGWGLRALTHPGPWARATLGTRRGVEPSESKRRAWKDEDSLRKSQRLVQTLGEAGGSLCHGVCVGVGANPTLTTPLPNPHSTGRSGYPSQGISAERGLWGFGFLFSVNWKGHTHGAVLSVRGDRV